MQRKNLPVLFTFGGLGYMGVELLWRRRTHSSMFLAGGSCFLLLGQIHKATPSVPLRAFLGSAAITGVELLTGLALNRDHKVWDYRALPLNFRGQICLPYSLLWMPLSLLGGQLYGFLTKNTRQLS